MNPQDERAAGGWIFEKIPRTITVTAFLGGGISGGPFTLKDRAQPYSMWMALGGLGASLGVGVTLPGLPTGFRSAPAFGPAVPRGGGPAVMGAMPLETDSRIFFGHTNRNPHLTIDDFLNCCIAETQFIGAGGTLSETVYYFGLPPLCAVMFLLEKGGSPLGRSPWWYTNAKAMGRILEAGASPFLGVGGARMVGAVQRA